MAFYTLQVSNHTGAGSRIPSQDASESWRTVYDGEICTAQDARAAVEQLAKFYRHARAFRGGGTLGKFWYAVLR